MDSNKEGHKIIRIRLKDSEYEALVKAASEDAAFRFKGRKKKITENGIKTEGRVNLSSYCRSKLLSDSSGINALIADRRFRALSYETNKIGVNINQIAKKINSGIGSPEDLIELNIKMDQILQLYEHLSEEYKEIIKYGNN